MVKFLNVSDKELIENLTLLRKEGDYTEVSTTLATQYNEMEFSMLGTGVTNFLNITHLLTAAYYNEVVRRFKEAKNI